MTNSFRAALAAATCTLALAGLTASAASETLAEAVALAYQTNPTLRAQRAQQRAADETVVQAQSAYAPSADVSGTIRYDENFNTGQGDTDGGASLNVRQSLYSGGRIAASVSGARADVLTGREQVRSVESNLILNVIRAYVDIRRDEEGLRIRNENVAVLRRQVEETGARFEVGEITRTDVAQSESRLALALGNLANAQAALANSRARYASVVGQNPAELAPEPPLPALPATVEEAFAVAQAESPEVRGAQYAELAARARVRAARAEFGPSVNLDGTYSASRAPLFGADRTLFSPPQENVNQSASVRLGANLPLFSGGLNASRVRQALERENAARLRVEEAQRGVLNDVAQAWNGLLAARASMTANQEQVRATTVAFEGASAEAQVGLRTTLDVLNAQQELRNAELLLVNARRDAYVAEASVLAAMGRLQAQNLVAGVPIYDTTYTVQRRGLRDGAMPYEGFLERLDGREPLTLERPSRITVPVVEAPLTDTPPEWRPQSAPVVVPRPQPPAVGPAPMAPQ